MLDEVEHSGEGGAVTTALSRHSVSVPASAVARDCDTYMSAKHAPCGGSDGGESEGDGLPRELETNPPVTFETSHSMERIAYMEFDPTDPAVRRLVELTDIPLDLEGRRVLAEDETFQARESTERGSSKRRVRGRRRTSSSPAAEPSWPLSDLEPADGGAPRGTQKASERRSVTPRPRRASRGEQRTSIFAPLWSRRARDAPLRPQAAARPARPSSSRASSRRWARARGPW